VGTGLCPVQAGQSPAAKLRWLYKLRCSNWKFKLGAV
jgi:hypothetical protein